MLEILRVDNRLRALRRTFSPGGCPAGHWNGSRDGGGAWWSGARLETGTWWELARFLLRRRTLGQWCADATKPCRLWDGGSVSGRIKSLAAWLAPQAANFSGSSGSYLNDSYGSSLIQPFRTRMGPLNRIAPANTGQACRRPWGACESAADAYLALTRKTKGSSAFI